MKFLIFVSIIGFLGFTFATPTNDHLQGIVDGLINQTINDLLKKLDEPITSDSIVANLTGNTDTISGTASLSNFSLGGLKELVATKLDVSILGLSLDGIIEVPTITLNTKYDADIKLQKWIPLWGRGDVIVDIGGIEVYVSGKVSINDGLGISNATVSFTIKRAWFRFTGLFYDDELSYTLGEILNTVVVSFVNDYQDWISSIISPIAGEIINDLLDGGTKSEEFLQFKELYTHQLLEEEINNHAI